MIRSTVVKVIVVYTLKCCPTLIPVIPRDLPSFLSMGPGNFVAFLVSFWHSVFKTPGQRDHSAWECIESLGLLGSRWPGCHAAIGRPGSRASRGIDCSGCIRNAGTTCRAFKCFDPRELMEDMNQQQNQSVGNLSERQVQGLCALTIGNSGLAGAALADRSSGIWLWLKATKHSLAGDGGSEW